MFWANGEELEMYEQVVAELYGHSRGGCGTLSSWFKVAAQFPSTGEQHLADISRHLHSAPASLIFLVDVSWGKARWKVGGKVLSTVATA